MNKIRLPVFIVLGFVLPVIMQCATAQTQTELSEQTCTESQEADKELDLVYRQVMRAYEGEKRFTAALKKAQLGLGFFPGSSFGVALSRREQTDGIWEHLSHVLLSGKNQADQGKNSPTASMAGWYARR